MKGCIEMKKAEYQPIASKQMTQDGGIAIYDIEYGCDDHVIAGWVSGDTQDTPRKYKVYYTISGRAYFRRYGRREYIDEYMRL